MIDSLYISACGLSAHQQQVDVIANNIANLNTTGFKKNRVDFEDLMYRQATPTAAGGETETRRLGTGVAIGRNAKVFSAGEMKKTDNGLDIAINGSGFFEIAMPDGTTAYTRTGSFKVDQQGFLVNLDGYPLMPLVQVPSDAEKVVIEGDGQVLITLASEKDPVEIGAIELANFVNPGGLEEMGANLYRATTLSGDAYYTTPGENGIGSLAQGYVETSNVDLVEELTVLMTAQRAYELNAKVVQVADEMLALVNNLRR